MTNSLIAQLVQHCTSIAEVKCQIPFTFASNYIKSNSRLTQTKFFSKLKKINNYISFTTGLPQVIIIYY